MKQDTEVATGALASAALMALEHPLIVTGTDLVIRMVNPAAAACIGVDAAELQGQALDSCLSYPADLPAPVALETASARSVQVRGRCTNCNAQAHFIPFSQGADRYLVISLHALGPARQRERQLAQAADRMRESEADLRQVLRAAEMGLWTLLLQGNQLVASHWVRSVYDLEQEGEIGLEALLTCVHAEDRAAVQANWQRLSRGDITELSHSYRVVGKDGHSRFLAERVRRFDGDADEAAERLIAVVMDVSVMHEAEQKQRAIAKRLKALTQHLLVQQEDERRELSRILHDDIGQSLTASIITLQSSQMGVMDMTADIYAELNQSLSGCLNLVREMSLNLRPSQLDDLGLEQALDWYLQRHCELQGRDYALAVELQDRLPTEIKNSCFRIIQDVVRHLPELHSQGAISVTVRQADRHVVLDMVVAEVTDAAAASRGSGWLAGADERAAMVGGELSLEYRDNRVRVVVTLPFNLQLQPAAL